MQTCISSQTTTPTSHHSVFYRPDALPAAQPTASKHKHDNKLKVSRAGLIFPQSWKQFMHSEDLKLLTSLKHIKHVILMGVWSYSHVSLANLMSPSCSLTTTASSSKTVFVQFWTFKLINCSLILIEIFSKQQQFWHYILWVNVSSGTSSPGLSWTNSTEP